MPVNSRLFLLSILFVFSFASIGASILNPILPEVVRGLGLPSSAIEMSVALYLGIDAIGQLAYGPIANALGRKRTLFWGASIALTGAVMGLLTIHIPSSALFYISRSLTAAGACSGLVVAMAMIADSSSLMGARFKLAIGALSFAAIPLAVSGGSFLSNLLGPQGAFLGLIAYCLIIVVVAIRLPETYRPSQRTPLAWKETISGYVEQVTDPLIVFGGVLMGGVTALTYLFAAKAPGLFLDHYGISAARFGLYNFIPSVGYVIGAIVSSTPAARRVSSRVLAPWGLIIITVSSVVCFIVMMIFPDVVWPIFVAVGGVSVGIVILYSVVIAIATIKSSDNAYGSGLLSFLTIAVSAGLIVLSRFVLGSAPHMLPLIFIAMACLLSVPLAIFLREYRTRTVQTP